MRIWRALRSRRLAVWLLAGLTAYTAVAASVPQTSVDAAAAAAWDAANPGLAPLVAAAGLHSAFSMPLFLGACLLVGLSTAACAWERSLSAISDLRALRTGALPTGARVLQHIELPAHLEASSAIGAARRALVALRLSLSPRDDAVTDAGEGTTTGRSQWFGLLGSPLFHWAIAGLMLAAAVGQLTRYEAVVDLVVGDTVQDTAGAYGEGLTAGPFASGFSSSSLRLDEVDFDHMAGGVARGSAPRISVEREGDVRTTEWVFPNHPLRLGSMSIHRSAVAPVLQGTVRTSSGDTPIEAWFAFDDRSPRAVDVPAASGDGTTSLVITPLGDQRVGIALAETIDDMSDPVGVGETVEFAEGFSVTVDALTYGAQVRVVRDWTMPIVFAMFLLLALGSSLTVFMPTRMVRVEYMPAASDGRDGSGTPGHTLCVRVSCPKSDPAFPARVREAITAALATEDCKETA